MRYYGCTPWPSIVKLEIAEFWQKPWETFPFTVPLEDGDRMSYDDGKTPSIWQRWYDANQAAQGAHDAVLDIIVQHEVWREPNTKKVGDLIEIKFKGGGVQHRVFGFYGSGVKQQFIVVGFGYHKQKVYHPKDILKTCAKRRTEIEGDSKKATDCARPEAPEIPE